MLYGQYLKDMARPSTACVSRGCHPSELGPLNGSGEKCISRGVEGVNPLKVTSEENPPSFAFDSCGVYSSNYGQQLEFSRDVDEGQTRMGISLLFEAARSNLVQCANSCNGHEPSTIYMGHCLLLVATNTICATLRTFNNIIRFRARQTIQLW